jgi:hypothetical protein
MLRIFSQTGSLFTYWDSFYILGLFLHTGSLFTCWILQDSCRIVEPFHAMTEAELIAGTPLTGGFGNNRRLAKEAEQSKAKGGIWGYISGQ